MQKAGTWAKLTGACSCNSSLPSSDMVDVVDSVACGLAVAVALARSTVSNMPVNIAFTLSCYGLL
jgi:hypothetical protein